LFYRFAMKRFIPYVVIAVICLAVGFSAGFEYQAYRIRSTFQQAFTNASVNNSVNNTPNSTPTPATAMQAAKDVGMKTINKKVGDEVVLDTGKILVNSVNETQTLTSSFSNPAVATAGTKFVVVNLTLTNITNSDFTFSPDEALTFVDAKNREYHVFLNELATDLTYKNLSPSVPMTGTLVYQIPTDAASYSLVTSKSSTKELYKIVLK
jgi:hypothetical protein